MPDDPIGFEFFGKEVSVSVANHSGIVAANAPPLRGVGLGAAQQASIALVGFDSARFCDALDVTLDG